MLWLGLCSWPISVGVIPPLLVSMPMVMVIEILYKLWIHIILYVVCSDSDVLTERVMQHT